MYITSAQVRSRRPKLIDLKLDRKESRRDGREGSKGNIVVWVQRSYLPGSSGVPMTPPRNFGLQSYIYIVLPIGLEERDLFYLPGIAKDKGGK